MGSASPRPSGRVVHRIGTLLLAGLLPAFASTAHASEQQIFLKLVDASGNAVTDLRPEEVTVVEDGAPRTVTALELVDWPTKLSVLVDNGPGTTTALSQLRNGLNGFFEALPVEGFEASIYTLNPQPRRIVRMTDDREELLDGINIIAPDSGAPRFLEGLDEATKRIDDDDSDHFAVIMMIATDGSEGSSFRQRDIERLGERIAQNGIQLHIVMMSGTAGTISSNSDRIQVELGLRLTEFTRGRYENITAGSRLQTLLPEFGEMIAAAHEAQRSQYRVTYERPDDAPAPTKGVSATTARGGTRGMLSFDGHIQPE